MKCYDFKMVNLVNNRTEIFRNPIKSAKNNRNFYAATLWSSKFLKFGEFLIYKY